MTTFFKQHNANFHLFGNSVFHQHYLNNFILSQKNLDLYEEENEFIINELKKYFRENKDRY